MDRQTRHGLAWAADVGTLLRRYHQYTRLSQQALAERANLS